MTTPLWNTRNNLPLEVRGNIVTLLNRHLADGLDLVLQAKQAHWNVKGPNFIALHELFDEVVEQALDYADEMAERAVELGGTALGTARIVASASRLDEYPLDAASGPDHVRALAEALARFGGSLRPAIDTAAELDDADTADLFTEISRGIDKLLWKVEAHDQR